MLINYKKSINDNKTKQNCNYIQSIILLAQFLHNTLPHKTKAQNDNGSYEGSDNILLTT